MKVKNVTELYEDHPEADIRVAFHARQADEANPNSKKCSAVIFIMTVVQILSILDAIRYVYAL